jgi:hypothetical protein
MDLIYSAAQMASDALERHWMKSFLSEGHGRIARNRDPAFARMLSSLQESDIEQVLIDELSTSRV